MSTLRWMSGLVFLAWAGNLSAQTVPYETTVVVPEVEVRSGPSNDPKMYPTSKLRQGDRVTVVELREDGWLGIKPPAGSFSWINDRDVHKDSSGLTAVVMGEDVPVLLGSELVNERPTVEAKKRLKRGAQIVLLKGTEVVAEDGRWLPIAPTEGELRYVPTSALAPAAAVHSSISHVQTGNPSDPLAANAAPFPQANEDPLWQQALREEFAGNHAEAERLYAQLARQTPDHDLQIRCYNRIHFLRQGQHVAASPGHHPAGHAAYPTDPNRLAPTPAPPIPQPLPGKATSQYTYFREDERPRGTPVPIGQPTSVPVVSQPSPNPTANLQSTGRGTLRRASIFIDQKPAYAFEFTPGQFWYVTAQPGLNLDLYLNRPVDLTGTVIYRGDLKRNYMVVHRVSLLQP
jgi:SH3-like domain-containing protein